VEENAGVVAGSRHHTGCISALANTLSPISNKRCEALGRRCGRCGTRSAELV